MTVRVRRDVLTDKAVLRSMTRVAAGRPDEATVARVGEEVSEALARFAHRGWIDDPASYHRTPPPPEGVRERQERTGRLRYTLMTWPDGFEVRPEEPGAERYASYPRIGIARAAILEHRNQDRPWLVCAHGFGMGSPALDLRTFRALHLHRELGLNLAFLTLPFHGRRRPTRSPIPKVPGIEILDNVHGLAQAVWDLRQLLSHVRARTDLPVGVMGLSLGGCTAALAASLDDVDAAVLLVPVADLGAVIAEKAAGPGPGGEEEAALAARSQALLGPVSPLSLSPRVPRDQRLIVAGTLDQFVRPSAQAVPLWHHWDRPPLHWYHGGHVSVFWGKGVQDAVDGTLRSAALAPSEAPVASEQA